MTSKETNVDWFGATNGAPRTNFSVLSEIGCLASGGGFFPRNTHFPFLIAYHVWGAQDLTTVSNLGEADVLYLLTFLWSHWEQPLGKSQQEISIEWKIQVKVNWI